MRDCCTPHIHPSLQECNKPLSPAENLACKCVTWIVKTGEPIFENHCHSLATQQHCWIKHICILLSVAVVKYNSEIGGQVQQAQQS